VLDQHPPQGNRNQGVKNDEATYNAFIVNEMYCVASKVDGSSDLCLRRALISPSRILFERAKNKSLVIIGEGVFTIDLYSPSLPHALFEGEREFLDSRNVFR
jgi:hypothetical protein